MTPQKKTPKPGSKKAPARRRDARPKLQDLAPVALSGAATDDETADDDLVLDEVEQFVVPSQADFLTRFGLLEPDLERAGITWPELTAIGEHHVSRRHELETTADYIASRLRAHPAVHSVKSRVKNPSHLFEKILRKRLESPGRLIDRRTYTREITDLIGIRVLHLFKGEWLPIHKFITSSWDVAETPTANIRKGDSDVLVSAFKAAGCRINEHRMGYRSIHYLVKSRPSRRLHIAELQVRTIFEEGWSEIDHSIRYPYQLNNAVLNEFLSVFNSLAGSADEMGTFIQTLRDQLETWEAKRAADAADHARTVEQLKTQIGKLEIDATEKNKLEQRVKDLEKRASPPSHVSFGGTSIGTVLGDYLGTINSTVTKPYLVTGASNPPGVDLGFTDAVTIGKTCERCGTSLPFGLLSNAKYCTACGELGGGAFTISRP